MKIVIDAPSTTARETLIKYLTYMGFSWAWQEERPAPVPTLEHLTLDPSRLNPADLERLKRVFANPAPFAHLCIEDPWYLDANQVWPKGTALRRDPTKYVQTATGADLDALVAKRGYIEPRKEGETDEVFRQRALHTHEVKPCTISFDPALCAPYVGTRYNKDDLPKDIYASFAVELSKMTPGTFRELYQCTPRTTREGITSFLLNNRTNMSREWVESLPDINLLDVAKECGVPRQLVQALRRQIEEAPGVWTRHDGGPCPVRHEEVEVQMRGYPDAVKRCWPEAVNWHWGRPGSAATAIDVLRWRRV